MELHNLSQHLFSDSQHQSQKKIKFPYYLLDGRVLFENGDLWSAEKAQYVDDLEFNREKIDVKLNQLHKTDFKVISPLKEMLKDKKREINELVLEKREEINECNVDILNQESCLAEVESKYKRKIELCEQSVQNMEKVINNHKMANSKTPTSYVDVEQVKDIPISDYVDFNRAGFAPCLFHDEKTPSMKYYKNKNRVHCFGCNQGGDVVDVIQQLHDCDMKKALAILSGKST